MRYRRGRKLHVDSSGSSSFVEVLFVRRSWKGIDGIGVALLAAVPMLMSARSILWSQPVKSPNVQFLRTSKDLDRQPPLPDDIDFMHCSLQTLVDLFAHRVARLVANAAKAGQGSAAPLETTVWTLQFGAGVAHYCMFSHQHSTGPMGRDPSCLGIWRIPGTEKLRQRHWEGR